jgi:hypothetical protein
MTKVAIVVLADTETHGDLGRIANALTSAQDFKEAGDEATIVFDGAGTKWIGELSRPDHKLHEASGTLLRGRAPTARSPSELSSRCRRAASHSWKSTLVIPASRGWCPRATR